jgi:multidrug resistance efflux pump
MKNHTLVPNGAKVRTPLSRSIQTLNRRILPFAVWCGAIVVLVFLGRTQITEADAVGIVERRDAAVIPLIDGTIARIGVACFDMVNMGDVVAILDDSLFQAKLKTAQADLLELRAELEAEREALERERLNDLRRFELNEEESKLDHLDRIVTQEADKVTLARLTMLMRMQESLVSEGIEARQIYEDTRLRVETLETKIAENKKAIAFASERLQAASRRKDERAEQTAQAELGSSLRLQPLREAIAARQARIDELAKQGAMHILKAPMTGMVSELSVSNNETVMSGMSLMEITDPSGSLVRAWVGSSHLREIRPGAPVQIVSRRHPRLVVKAKVLKVGTRVERYPLRLRPNPDLPLFGLSVLLGKLPEGLFFPGEVLDVRFLPDKAGS